MTTTPSAARFAAVFATLYAAHQVADHWVQTGHQAATKGRPGWTGRRACAAHVATYTATAALALAATSRRTRLGLDPGRAAVALTISAATHYLADRRAPLRRLAELTGSADFHALGACRPGRDDNPTLGTGAYALDQSFHIGMLFAAALIAA
jgi:hypothetical protein